MENNKLKMKYHLGIWKTLPGYPTDEDLIFELNSYLVREGKPDGEFTIQTFNSFLPANWENTKHGEIVNKLIESEIFEKQHQKSKSKITYKVKNNPHY